MAPTSATAPNDPRDSWINEVTLDQRHARRQQFLFVYGTGLAVGLYLGLVHAYIWKSWRLFFEFLAGATLFATTGLVLWRYVFPRFANLRGARYIALQVAVCIFVFSAVSLIATEFDGWMRGSATVFRAYEGGPRTLVIPVDALRWAPLIYTLIPIIPTALLCVVGYNLYWWRIVTMQSRERELRDLAVSAQLAALRAQINPHFFFNSLNSIAQLIETEPAKAEACVERLADIFRYMLKRTDNEFVALADELEIAEAYLHIEKARFGSDLRVEEHIDETVRGLRMPGLILQPLVENAVRHGISTKIGGGEVRIQAGLEQGDLQLVVADTGVGIRERETVFERGVGLRNLRDRLVRLYGPKYAPLIDSDEGTGTRVTVRIPVQWKEAA